MRKTTRRSTRPSKRAALYRTQARAAAAKKTAQKSTSSMNVMPIDNFLNQVRAYARVRAARYGSKDLIARNLLRHSSNVRAQFRKINIVNPDLSKHL